MAKRPYTPDSSMALTTSQHAQLSVLEELIQRYRVILGLPSKTGEHCSHAVDLLRIAYELKHQVRTGELIT